MPTRTAHVVALLLIIAAAPRLMPAGSAAAAARAAAAPAAPTQTGSGPRLAPLPEQEWTAVEREVVASWNTSAAVPNDVRTYLRHPVLAKNLIPFERYIAGASTLAPRERALLILRTAWLCKSAYVWAHHAAAARAAGLGADDLTRIARGPGAPGWSAFDAALLRAADELHVSAFVNDDTWRALSARYDTRQMMDALFTVAEFTMVAGTVNSLGVPIEDGLRDRLPEVPYVVTAKRNDDRLIGKPPRVTPLEPAEWSPEVRQWLDRTGSGRPVAGIYRTYARHLPMDQPRTLVSEHIRQSSTLTARVRGFGGDPDLGGHLHRALGALERPVGEALHDPLVGPPLPVAEAVERAVLLASLEPELVAGPRLAEREVARERVDDGLHLGGRELEPEQRLVQGLVPGEPRRDRGVARRRRGRGDRGGGRHDLGGGGRGGERLGHGGEPARGPRDGHGEDGGESEPREEGGEAAAGGEIVGGARGGHRPAI